MIQEERVAPLCQSAAQQWQNLEAKIKLKWMIYNLFGGKQKI